MHRTVEPTPHGVLDYALVLLLLVAPALFGFAGVAASLCYTFALVHFAMSALTKYPLGLAKVIPFPLHGSIELAAGIFFLLAPFLFGFSDRRAPTLFFIALGIGVGVLYALTNYHLASSPSAPPAHRKRRAV